MVCYTVVVVQEVISDDHTRFSPFFLTGVRRARNGRPTFTFPKKTYPYDNSSTVRNNAPTKLLRILLL